ncbi:hypothetical protein ATL39_0175 [Sinobaca qinghaiensis]|uniref:Uncharacterized protein n=1 Tax=Sinobaca qinghaiensis TaxID=342944 RepID=A0A419V7B8_9BACL|nr:hypothetical protein [Sinobaca qinghaiensis]RKD75965.1 hypothetical protein ATL39_0175 [Sinobaca qinghaiensis]
MPDKSFLKEGLIIMAQSRESTNNIWEAHFGAAAIAGYFFIKENQLSAEAVNLIEFQTDLMIKQHSQETVINEEERLDFSHAEDIILKALEETIDELHWVGHNVIYAALSLLALKEAPGYSVLYVSTQIAELVRSFAKTTPGRSWIGYSASDVKKLTLDEKDKIAEINDPYQLSAFVLEELAQFKEIYHAEAHHDLIGHMLTFSHALNILYDLGHNDYFQRGLPSFLKLVKVLRVSREGSGSSTKKLISPVDRYPLIKAARSEYLPIEAVFWKQHFTASDWDFGHVFKFPFSFYNHLNRLTAVPEQAAENFRYILSSD